MAESDHWSDFDAEKKRQGDVCRYPGKELSVLYDRKRCMHAAECGRASHEVFNAQRSPWIDPDQVEKDLLLNVVRRCPTGALRALDDSGGVVPDDIPSTNEVTVCPDGPIYLRGDLRMEVDGVALEETRLGLCRCGTSRNKPFCDATHAKARFRDAGGVNSDGDGAAKTTGPLTVKIVDNGPLLLRGEFVLRAASGRVAMVGEKTALCRCGNSKNKPFCDGAHKSDGWRSIDGR
jgi:CDGSH-type Zn-finger protein/uncharacterized Fe-S cluster protein YjdI